MKSGIYIRIGTRNVDIVDTNVVDFAKWWDSLNERQKLATVRHVLLCLREAQK